MEYKRGAVEPPEDLDEPHVECTLPRATPPCTPGPRADVNPRAGSPHLKRMMTKLIPVPVGEAGHSAAVALVRGIARDQGSSVRLLRVLPVPERVVGPLGRTIAYVDQE